MWVADATRAGRPEIGVAHHLLQVVPVAAAVPDGALLDAVGEVFNLRGERKKEREVSSVRINGRWRERRMEAQEGASGRAERAQAGARRDTRRAELIKTRAALAGVWRLVRPRFLQVRFGGQRGWVWEWWRRTWSPMMVVREVFRYCCHRSGARARARSAWKHRS